ncbi:MAG: transcriptional regulator Spx [Erysipelotrichaceae bacterium]|nr:transcriptional regulator Spx [Erysipelotrichaceae bacterium]
MIVVYTSPGCASCRKVKQWLKDRDLPYEEKNIFTSILREDEIKELLVRSVNGTDDIISKRSKIIKEGNIDVDSMSTNSLIRFIQQNPSVLRRPIIIDDHNFLVGYDNEEIDVFVPRELRKIARRSCVYNCPNYDTCGHFLSEEESQEKSELAI